MTLVGLVMMSKTAERFWDWATSASMSSRVASASMAKRTVTSLEAVADVGVGAEDAEDVHVALDGRGDRAQLDLAVLCDRGDAGGQATDQADEHELDRRGAMVFGGEALGVVGVELECGAVVLRPRPEKPSTVERLWVPFTRCRSAPGELGRLGGAVSASRASSRAALLTPLSIGGR